MGHLSRPWPLLSPSPMMAKWSATVGATAAKSMCLNSMSITLFLIGVESYPFGLTEKYGLLCANVMMVQAAGFIHGEFDHFFGAWGEANLTKHNAIATSDHGLNG